MGLVALSGALALAGSLLTGGSLRELAGVRVAGLPLLVAAVLAQALALVGPGAAALRAGLVAVSLLAVAVVIARNHRLPGLLLIGAGLLLNALVVGLNGAMPVSLAAAAHAGISERELDLGREPGREEAGADTRGSWLGDTLPFAFPPRREVVSAGDVLVAAGAASYLATGVRPPGARRGRGPSPRA